LHGCRGIHGETKWPEIVSQWNEKECSRSHRERLKRLANSLCQGALHITQREHSSTGHRVLEMKQHIVRVPCSCPALLTVPCACRPNHKIQSDKLKAHSAVFAVQAVFALWYIVGHAVLSQNDPLTFALFREVLSACALLLLAQSIEGDINVKSKSDMLDIFVLVRPTLAAT
jgi:hypothetical protein